MKYYVSSISIEQMKEIANKCENSLEFIKLMNNEKWLTFGNTYRADNFENLVQDIIEAGMVSETIYIYVMTKEYYLKNMPKNITKIKSFENKGIINKKELNLISDLDFKELMIPEDYRVVDFSGAKLITRKILKNNFKEKPYFYTKI